MSTGSQSLNYTLASGYSVNGTATSGGIGSGTVQVNIDNFVLYGPRSGDTIKVSYLDELNGGGSLGTITTVKAFGTTGETGTLAVDKTTVDINDFFYVTVVDGNLNASSSSRESVAATSWRGTTTSNRGDILTIAAYDTTAKESAFHTLMA